MTGIRSRFDKPAVRRVLMGAMSKLTQDLMELAGTSWDEVWLPEQGSNLRPSG
jgi:hypothetical protein